MDLAGLADWVTILTRQNKLATMDAAEDLASMAPRPQYQHIGELCRNLSFN